MAIIEEQNLLAEILSVSRMTIRNWLVEDDMPHIRQGFRYYFDTKEVSKWLKKYPKRAHLAETLNKYEG
jgi:excisionase family DNA binding protein